MSKFCKKCGRELSDEAKFCTHCGQPCFGENEKSAEEVEESAKEQPQIGEKQEQKREKISKMESPGNYCSLHFMCSVCRIFCDLSASDSAYRTAEK